MTFQQLEYILEIRRTGSISQAAKKFYVSQASISRAVNALERELGVQIFHRSWNGVQPTEQGCAVLEEANRICESWRRMSEGKNLSRREVRVSMTGFRPMHDAFVRLQQEFRDALNK